MRDCSWLSADSTMMNSPCLPMPSLSMLPSSAPQYESPDWHCSQIEIKQERPDHMMDHDSSATSGVGSNSGASPGGCSSASSEGSPPGSGQATAPATGQACLASPTPASATSPRSGSTLNYDPIQSLQGLAPESARRSPTSPPTPADENSRSSDGSYEEGDNQPEHMDTSSGGNQIMSQGNVLRCHLCEFTDTSREVMSEHIASHYDNQEPGLSPDEADDGEYDEASLSTPKFNAQGKVKTFRCKNCGHLTVTKVAFWAHHRTHIKEDRVLECPRCPFVTEYKHHLEYHLRNHFNSKPYKCDKCSYACVNKSMLNSHLKSHSNVYQYHCQDCAYATKYCHSLKLHLRKYGHRPSMVLNPDGSPNPLPIIDVYGTRRGPKNKSNLPSSGTTPSQTQPGVANSPSQPSSVPLPPSQTQMFPFGLMTPGIGYQNPSAVRRCPYCEFYCADAEQLAKHMFLHTDPSVIHFLQANNNNNNVNNNNNPEGLKDYLASLMWQQSNIARPQIQAQRTAAPLPTVQAPQSTAPPQASPQIPPTPTTPHTPPPAHSPPVTSSPTPTTNPQAPSSPVAPTKPVRTAAPLDLSMPETSNDDAEEVHRNDGSTQPAPSAGKNRRKGRAFKLERIAMLLQQQTGDESEVVSAAFAAAAAAAASQPSPPSSPPSPAGLQSPATPAPQATSVQEAYNCTYCDITFKDVVMYTMHMGYHGYQDPFLCNMCGQQTTDKVSFFLHVARSSHC